MVTENPIDQSIDQDNMELSDLHKQQFSNYVKQIDDELQRKGVIITQSEILGYVLENMISNYKTGIIDKKKNRNRLEHIFGSPSEFTDFIIAKKYPHLFQNLEDKQLNFVQKILYLGPFNRFSQKTNNWMFRMLRFTNIAVLLIFLFFGLQSNFSIIFLIVAPNDLISRFSIFNGQLILYYEYWEPQMVLYLSIIFFLNQVVKFTITSFPSLQRSISGLNDYLLTSFRRNKLIIFSFINFILYLILGSIAKIDGQRVNGYDPYSDLLLPFTLGSIIMLISLIPSIRILSKKQGERKIPKKISLHSKIFFFLTSGITKLLTIIVLLFFSILIYDDYNSFSQVSNNFPKVYYDLTGINVYSFIINYYMVLLFTFSTFFQSSNEISIWIKSTSKQILIQLLIISLYLIVFSYIVYQYNSFVSNISNATLIDFSEIYIVLFQLFIPILLILLIFRTNK